MSKILATTSALAVAATSIYLYRVQTKISPISPEKISSSLDIPYSFQTSPSTRIVNPNSHVTTCDIRSIALKLPKNLSDEEILARFVKGFFGGYVLGPERVVLRVFGKELFGFKALKDSPVSTQIWSGSQISTRSLPPPHALLFGAFCVIDRHFPQRSIAAKGHSYVEIAHGSDNGLIAGVNRFSVSRNSVAEDGEDGDVTVEYASWVCNPKVNKPIATGVLHRFHLWYAMLLFREGIAEVMGE